MSEAQAGAVPNELDERLRRRDTAPLAKDDVLRVQAINRGKSPVSNQRFTVNRKGEVFSAGHSEDSSDWQTPFDVPMPKTPGRKLDLTSIAALRRVLDTEFAKEPPYHSDPSVEGGLFMVVTARVKKGIHEVIYDAVQPPVLKRILELAWEQE